MGRWTCPDCRRQFGRRGQSHTCSPGLTIEEYFATAREWERPVFDVVAGHLQRQGDVIIDPIGVGILFKNGPTFCSLRTMTRWTALGFSLGRRLSSDKLSRKVTGERGRFHHVINISDPAQVDDEVLEWLTEAYHTAGDTLGLHQGARAPGSDPMVPDDIDDVF
ncbi:MAG: DUF5655 domain-containing protein [Acidimicrobiia bacterium]|nr:DUF5655 domain-containing protein [Acidimicrobiia bacterium]